MKKIFRLLAIAYLITMSLFIKGVYNYHRAVNACYWLEEGSDINIESTMASYGFDVDALDTTKPTYTDMFLSNFK